MVFVGVCMKILFGDYVCDVLVCVVFYDVCEWYVYYVLCDDGYYMWVLFELEVMSDGVWWWGMFVVRNDCMEDVCVDVVVLDGEVWDWEREWG